MKKIFLALSIMLSAASAKAQLIPNFDFGIKGGINISQFSKEIRFSSENRAGYLVGIWARAGAMGLHFQPELYYASKRTEVVEDNGPTGEVDFTSIDLPLLVGTKVGALGFGGRFNTGPMVSFILNEDQSFGDAISNASRFNFKNQALAWQFGAGLDIRKISIDLRYEHGLSRISRAGYNDTKIRLFNLSLGYKLY